jgi:hypothetical protein
LGWCNFDLFGFVCRRSLKEGFVYKGDLKLQDILSWVQITTTTDILLRLYFSPVSHSPGLICTRMAVEFRRVGESVGLAIHSGMMSCKSRIFLFHKFVDTLYGIPTFQIYFIIREGKKKLKKKLKKIWKRICIIRNFHQFFRSNFNAHSNFRVFGTAYIGQSNFYLFGAAP